MVKVPGFLRRGRNDVGTDELLQQIEEDEKRKRKLLEEKRKADEEKKRILQERAAKPVVPEELPTEKSSVKRKLLDILGWKIDVYIMKKTMYGVMLMKDVGKIVTQEHGDKYDRYLMLKKNKKELPVPPSDRFLFTNKRLTVFLASTVERDFSPMQMHFADPKLKETDESVRLWHSYAVRRSYERFKKQGMLDKLMPVLIPLAVGIGAAIVIYVSGIMAVEYANIMSGAAGNLASQVGRLSDVIDKMPGVS